MPKKDYIVVGKAFAVHGIKGWLSIKSYTHPTENIFKYNLYIKKDANFGRVEITEYKIMPKKIILKIKSVDSIDDAETYLNKDIFVYKENLPPTETDEHYWHKLINRKVLNENNLEIGIVTSIFSTIFCLICCAGWLCLFSSNNSFLNSASESLL